MITARDGAKCSFLLCACNSCLTAGKRMAFIVLIKLRTPDAKELVTTLDALRKEEEQRRIKFLGI